MSEESVKPVRRFGEAAYAVGIVLCALGVAISAKSGLGVSHVVAPAFILSSYLEPVAPVFTFGFAEYVVQGVLLLLLALFVKRVTVSYPLAFVTALIYGFTLDMWRLLLGAEPAEELYLLAKHIAQRLGTVDVERCRTTQKPESADHAD
ncbi:MAG: hypothetical protein J6T77_04435 [Clostridia bacterium]|nr:hypothetical protein [Clostridia bacterium]